MSYPTEHVYSQAGPTKAGRPSRSRNRTVKKALIAPAFEVTLVRILCGCLLVDIDTPSRLVVSVHIAAPKLWSSREYLSGCVVEQSLFLNPEVRRCQIQMHIV